MTWTNRSCPSGQGGRPAGTGLGAARKSEYYTFLSPLFLALPDKGLVECLRASRAGSTARMPVTPGKLRNGVCRINSWLDEQAGRQDGEILQDILMDRSRVLHGLYPGEGPLPSESLYHKPLAGGLMMSLQHPSGRTGGLAWGEMREPLDQLGMELQLMGQLYRRAAEEAPNLEEGRSAMLARELYEAHLGRWGLVYAGELQQYARTGLYQGAGMMLEGLLLEE